MSSCNEGKYTLNGNGDTGYAYSDDGHGHSRSRSPVSPGARHEGASPTSTNGGYAGSQPPHGYAYNPHAQHPHPSAHANAQYPHSNGSVNGNANHANGNVNAHGHANGNVSGNGNGGAPSHESRRRNAEQRASTLRSDALIGKVEPNRVFCKLCEKWVQLRQDSSYCAYPWLQHRGKCLARQ